MNYTIDEEMGILNKYNLNPNELFVIRILLLASEENVDYLHRYLCIPVETRGELRDILVILQNKGIILKSYKIPKKGENFNPSDIEFNKNFLKFFHRESFEMGKELFDAYPMFGTIQGSSVYLRGVSRKFDSLEDCYRAYGKAINWNPETHNKIIELLKWAEDKGIIQCSLATFVIDKYWIALEKLKEGGSTINFDAIKMV